MQTEDLGPSVNENNASLKQVRIELQNAWDTTLQKHAQIPPFPLFNLSSDAVIRSARASATPVVRLSSSVVYLFLLELPSRPASVSCCPSAGIPSRTHYHDCPAHSTSDNSFTLQHGAADKNIELKQINSTVNRMEGIKPPAEFVPYSNEKKMGDLESVV
ncbi:hypothetical protein LAZ67_10002662 [Cordylochernes scorpioides]|uniref:Uncharacterized protein n=1 Tax=Cordylochernes scorpioides TaxID=51811 RepID=A0ABY6KWS3_9ARAC|nr:hypothetical protein LAZ67_10002662 [Cordylochernes scorpioides]